MFDPRRPLHEQVDTHARRVDFSRIPPHEVTMIRALAARASKIIGDFAREKRNDAALLDPDPLLLELDFATTHVLLRLKLHDWMMSDDLTFADELGKMLAGINRPLCIFNNAYKLRFAATSQ